MEQGNLEIAREALGVCTATLGPWAERSGPRKVATAAAVLWGGGLALSGLGCHLQEIGLLYAGYGVLAGAGPSIAPAFTSPSYTLPTANWIRAPAPSRSPFTHGPSYMS